MSEDEAVIRADERRRIAAAMVETVARRLVDDDGLDYIATDDAHRIALSERP